MNIYYTIVVDVSPKPITIDRLKRMNKVGEWIGFPNVCLFGDLTDANALAESYALLDASSIPKVYNIWSCEYKVGHGVKLLELQYGIKNPHKRKIDKGFKLYDPNIRYEQQLAQHFYALTDSSVMDGFNTAKCIAELPIPAGYADKWDYSVINHE